MNISRLHELQAAAPGHSLASGFSLARIFSLRSRYVLAAALLAVTLSGCKSKQDKAIDAAKQQAASTGQPQQVISTDSNGNTVTTVVQPPVVGQTGQVVTTTVTPKAAAASTTPATTAGAGTATGTATGTGDAGQAPAAGQTQTQAQAAVAPAPPPQVHVARGTTLVIRIDQQISAKGSEAGERFTGQVVEPVVGGNGVTVIPRRTPVTGRVDYAHARGHFKGAAQLELRLTSMTLNGQRYPLDTRDVVETKKGKGKRTGAMVGGGTGLGLLLGGIAGGGKGALIGGLAGAGAGTAGAGLTGNRDLVIPAESVLRFRLKDDLVIGQ